MYLTVIISKGKDDKGVVIAKGEVKTAFRQVANMLSFMGYDVFEILLGEKNGKGKKSVNSTRLVP